MEIVFSPEADDDLREILEHGFREWDEDKALAYAARLSSTIQHLATFPMLGRQLAGIPARFRMFNVERHRVYYRVDPGRILVVRILHERSNRPVIME